MTTPQVWISTDSNNVDYDGEGPGSHWELAGEIDSMQEKDFYTYIQVQLGLRSSTRGTPEFYLDGDPDSPWVRSDTKPPFWVAIDPWGNMRTSIHGAHPTYYVSNTRAVSTPLVRRAPEGHPGRTIRPVKVPIRLKRTEDGVFTPWVFTD